MKRWLIAIPVALLLAALLAWIADNTSFKEVRTPVPMRGEAARNPFYAAIRLSQELGAEASWERVFTARPADSVILLSQWNWSLSRARREHIQKWVEAGGRLVVDGSLLGDIESFERWSGVSGLDDDEGTEELAPFSDDEPECIRLAENGSTRHLEVCNVYIWRSLAASRKIDWSLRKADDIHALRVAVGRGSVTVVNASPFRKHAFLVSDHPRLFVALTQLRQGDSILFLTEEDQASLPALVWRFGAPAVLLLLGAVLLALWRASPRFGPPVAPTEAVRRSLAEQIRGTGQFALRFGGGEALHAATARALRDAAIRRFPTYDRMSSSERVAALAGSSGIDAAEIAPALHFSGPRSPHELRQAITVLETVRRQLTTRKAGNGN